MRNSLYASMMVLFLAVASAPAWAEDPGRAAVRRGGETDRACLWPMTTASVAPNVFRGTHDRSDSE